MILFAILLFMLIALIWIVVIIDSLLVAAASLIGIMILIVFSDIAIGILLIGAAIRYLFINNKRET